MSDRDGPKSYDALARLRGSAGSRPGETGSAEAGDGASNVTRLPRRPRRVTEDGGERRRKTWCSEGAPVDDPAPTRPVMRSELQRETGGWPLVPDPDGAEPEGSVVDLAAIRSKRAGAGAPAAGIRRLANPRRIGDSADESSSTDGDHSDGPR